VVDIVEPLPAEPSEPPVAPQRRSVAIIALVVAVVCALFFVVLVFAKGSSDTAKTGLLGQAAPPIEATTVDGKRSISRPAEEAGSCSTSSPHGARRAAVSIPNCCGSPRHIRKWRRTGEHRRCHRHEGRHRQVRGPERRRR
jgi:hypothetical protein